MSESHNTPSQPEKKSLFRKEALANVTSKKYGNILLLNELSTTVFTLFCVGVIVMIVTFFSLFSYQRKIQVAGQLLPDKGLLKIISASMGEVVDIKVKEGQVVKAGDVLFVLNTDKDSVSHTDVNKTNAKLIAERKNLFLGERKQLKALSDQRITSLQKKVTDLNTDALRLDNQIELQRQRIILAEKALAQHINLQKQNFVSSAQVDQKQAEFLDLKQRLSDLERSKASTLRDASDIQASIRDASLQVTIDQSTVDKNISILNQDLTENEIRQNNVIKANKDGIIRALNVTQGQTVISGMTLGLIIPKDSVLQAEVYVPSRAIGFIKPGMNVLIGWQAFPYQKFGHTPGVIKEVTETTVIGDNENVLISAQKEPLYRVKVELPSQTIQAYGKEQPLRSGMLLSASIATDTRKIYEWILEPLFAITGQQH